MSAVSIIEVGPRDGLQNEQKTLTVDQRLELIARLEKSGLTTIEAGSFVSPKWVPQMAGSSEVLQQLMVEQAKANARVINYPVLTPNLQGYQGAIKAGAKEVAIFGAASESFSQKNINCSVDESLTRFEKLTQQARADGVRIRGYVSTIIACPYEGVIQPEQVVPVVRAMINMGCYEVSLGDTIGRGTPRSIQALLKVLLQEFKPTQLAIHCHDTYGMAIANIAAAIELGITTVDSSVGGAGGCPYAKGASGNVATEDVVYFMQQQGLESGVDLDELINTGQWLFGLLGKTPVSKVNQALANAKNGNAS